MDLNENAFSQRNSTSSSQGAGNDISHDQLQKRLERFKRRMNRKNEDSMSGRTTPASSIGPPSECGRALSTVSVPAIRHHHQHLSYTNNSIPAVVESATTSSNDVEANRTRAHLVRTLMQENEMLKSTLDKWAPVVSAYRTCHAMVQELNKKVDEKDATITQLNGTLKDFDQRGNESKLKLAEFQRRMELKDAALNQLKSKVIELKSQLENSQQAEAEARRQLQRAVPNQMQQQVAVQQQQQTAMAMVTMQLQRDMAECMSHLRQRDQELAALTSERDALAEACAQLQQALQAATSAAVAPISMEMSFKASPNSLFDRQTQTDSFEKAPLSSTTAHIQTDSFLLPNSLSVSVQFTSIDLQPVVIDLPEDFEKSEAFSRLKKEDAVCCPVVLVDNSCQWESEFADPSMLVIKNDCSTQSELVVMSDAGSQSEYVPKESASLIQSSVNLLDVSPVERISVSCDANLSGDFVEMSVQTNVVEFTDTAIGPILSDVFDKLSQTDCNSTAEFETQTNAVETREEGTNSAVSERLDGETQIEIAFSETATDPAQSLFSLTDGYSQSVVEVSDEQCQTESQGHLTSTAEFETQTITVKTCEEGTSPVVNERFDNETQIELTLTETATDPVLSLFSLTDGYSQSILELSDEQCQTESEQDLTGESPPAQVLIAADALTQTSDCSLENVGSNSILFVQHAETQVDCSTKADIGTDADTSIFSLRDASSQQDIVTENAAEHSNVGCQVSLDLSRRPSSPSESIMSSSDCFSSNLISAPSAGGNMEPVQELPRTPVGLSEIDALRAAVRLLSREKRDLQSRLATQLAKATRLNEIGPESMPFSSPSPLPLRFVSPTSPSSASSNSDGVHSSLSAIQRKITELREQLAAANNQQHS